MQLEIIITVRVHYEYSLTYSTPLHLCEKTPS